MIASITSSASLPGFTQNGVAAAPAPSTDFSTVLGDLAGHAINAIRQGESAALAGIQGQVPLLQVVDQVMEAERTLQASLAIRDKLVSAFLDISRMQI
ncbi:flagellar hook-basal body complex protein FliE [Aestuariivirga sp.]|uniref:flagellar hook-basal body complex protein FliE n=1 Tax=Aestuariivirga sp. TaxID=2650926 RepID=UPI0039E62A0C